MKAALIRENTTTVVLVNADPDVRVCGSFDPNDKSIPIGTSKEFGAIEREPRASILEGTALIKHAT